MNLFSRLIVIVFLVPLFCFSQTTPKFLIKAGKLYDSGKKTFLNNQFIFIEADKIVKVSNADKQNYPGYQIIDLSKATVTPGLIDAHTHFLYLQKSGSTLEQDIVDHSDNDRVLRGSSIAKSFLLAGFTTVRDLGNSGQYLDLTLKTALNKGWIEGPRMFISGPIISPPGGQFGKVPDYLKEIPAKEYSIVKTADEARSITVDHINKGVDVIKICATNDNGLVLSIDEMKAIVETAHKAGIKVTAHATYDEVVRDAVLAGVDGIEHGYGISDSTLQLMAQKGVYLVPTDGTFENYKAILNSEKNNISDDEIRKFVASSTDRLIRAVKAGVTIVSGSDMYLYTPRNIGLEAKNTIASYVEAGLPVKDVLQFATLNGAKAIGKPNELGVIKAGAFADIIAFDGDLETNFAPVIYDKVAFVMKAGIVYKK